MHLRWLDRLERKLGIIAIPGLAMFIAGMHAVVGILSQFKPELPLRMTLEPSLVMEGQLWRVLSFILVPPDFSSPLWLLFWVLMLYSYLMRLEAYWGDFQFTFFCLVGAATTAAAALLTGRGLTATAFHMSLFLAFARLNPDYEVYFFFVLPVRMKWLAWAFWFIIGWDMIFGGPTDRIALLAGLANYLLFFGPSHVQDFKLAWHKQRYRGRF